jgi:hypothetical protein
MFVDTERNESPTQEKVIHCDKSLSRLLDSVTSMKRIYDRLTETEPIKTTKQEEQ